jgi:hypothetical protein
VVRVVPRARLLRLGASIAVLAVLLAPAAQSTLAANSSSASPKHIFVIMLENHSQSSVLGDPSAPFINALASEYAVARNYYGVTHPSEPNYVAAISGSNWFMNDDNPANRYDHTNLVDQLEANHKTWAAYMEAMPSVGFLGDSANGGLYASKHNPFVLFDDIRNNPKRLANIKPFTSFASDLAHNKVADFVWISPDQCNDMHGGVSAQPGFPESPCPYSNAKNDAADILLKKNADAFVKSTVNMIRHSSAWTGNSAIFIISDENDYTGTASTDGWETAAGCCDSPILPAGYQFLKSDGVTPDGNTWAGGMYGGGLVPAVVVSTHGKRHFVGTVPFNHYSLLRTIEQAWNLGYLGNASDAAQVKSMLGYIIP